MNRFERVMTVALPAGDGPSAIPLDLKLPGAGNFEIEAWCNNLASNVYIVEGRYVDPTRLNSELPTLTTGGPLDVILVVPSAGRAKRQLPDDSNGVVTLWFESANGSTKTQAVQVKVTSC